MGPKPGDWSMFYLKVAQHLWGCVQKWDGGCTLHYCSSRIYISPKKTFNGVCLPPLGDISRGWDNPAATSDSLASLLPSWAFTACTMPRAQCSGFTAGCISFYAIAQGQHLTRWEHIHLAFLRGRALKEALEVFRTQLLPNPFLVSDPPGPSNYLYWCAESDH